MPGVPGPRMKVRRNPRDWPLATKITALSAGACVLVAVVLAFLGYRQAADGLEETTARALRSDGLLVTRAVSTWHTERLVDLRIIAANLTVRRFLAGDAGDRAALAAGVQEILDSHAEYASDVDSIAILDTDGTIVASSNPVDIGQSVRQRDYFQSALVGDAFTSGVSVSTITNAPSIFHSVPIKSASGAVIGVIRSRASLREMRAVVGDARGRVGSGAAGVLLDESGLVIASSIDSDWFLRPVVPLDPPTLARMVEDRRWGNNPTPEPLSLAELAPAITTKSMIELSWTAPGTAYRSIVIPISAPGWRYVAALPEETIDASARDFLRAAMLVALIVLAEVIILTALLARGITRRVRTVTDGAQQIALQDLPALVAVARALADGDLTTQPTITAEPVPVKGEDEIGQLGRAFNLMVTELKATETAFAETSANLRGLVGRILESSVRLAGTAEQLGSATAQASQTVEHVARSIQQVATGAQEQAVGAQDSHTAVTQLRSVIDQVARGAQAQASSVSTASGTAEQMAAAAEQAAASARTVAAASQQSHAAASQGALAVGATVEEMAAIRDVVIQATEKVEDLGRLGEEIGGVVEIIDEIAERTNLLALNAAIEAARAGEHGRGFAVVADEVKSLAERSQNETKTIAQMIREIQDGTREAVAAMEQGSQQVLEGSSRAEQAGRALDEILEAAEQAARQVGEIAATAQDLAAYSCEVSDAISAISAVVEEATAASEEMAVSAESAGRAISGIAAVAEEHSAVAEQVSTNASDVSIQVEEMSTRAQELAATAEHLRSLVAGFRLEATPRREPSSATQHPTPQESAAAPARLARAGR